MASDPMDAEKRQALWDENTELRDRIRELERVAEAAQKRAALIRRLAGMSGELPAPSDIDAANREMAEALAAAGYGEKGERQHNPGNYGK